MIHSRDGLSEFSERYFRVLSTKTFGREVKWLESAGSTNDIARVWADEGAPEGALVFADHQVGGRGRHGRTWTVSPGQNLTISIVLRPRMEVDHLGLVSLAAGVAVADTLVSCCPGHRVTLKWPNDVRIEGRKCCGILLESSYASRRVGTTLILGIGLNVNQRAFEGELSNSATSMALATGKRVEREEILALLVSHLEERYGQSIRESERIIGDYESLLDWVGQPVRVHEASGRPMAKGLLLGVDGTGALILQTHDGRRTYHAGEVTLQTK